METTIYWGYIGDYMHPSMLSLAVPCMQTKELERMGRQSFRRRLASPSWA